MLGTRPKPKPNPNPTPNPKWTQKTNPNPTPNTNPNPKLNLDPNFDYFASQLLFTLWTATSSEGGTGVGGLQTCIEREKSRSFWGLVQFPIVLTNIDLYKKMYVSVHEYVLKDEHL